MTSSTLMIDILGLQGQDHLFIAMILALFAFMAMSAWGKHKDQQKRKQMLNAISKNDRVMTVGGIIGSVVSTTDHNVTLKVDESANVKITVIRSAIQKVLTEGETPDDLQT